MSRFTVILPEGTVILKNEETGQILRLSACLLYTSDAADE